MLILSFERLIAWSSFLSASEGRRIGSHDFCLLQDDIYVPEIIQPLQSRRLSELTKISVDLGLRISLGVEIDHIIYSSRHGELANSSQLLRMIGRQEVLSPTLFSQSVHNSAVGSFSIIKNTHVPATSLSAGKNSFMMGLVSAFIYLKENPRSQVLYISADSQVPDDFCVGLKENNLPFACAILLKEQSSDSGRRITFSEEFDRTECPSGLSNPQTLDFLQWFFYGTSPGTLLGDKKNWMISEC